eukprot:g13948.t1
MPGFTRLYKFLLTPGKQGNSSLSAGTNISQAYIFEVFDERILSVLRGATETGTWEVTATSYIKRDDVGNETDDMLHLVHMTMDNNFLYSIVDKVISKTKAGSRSEQIIHYHLRREKVVKGIEYLWGDYYIRIGVTPDSNNAVIMQVEHRAIRDMNIALDLIDQLAKKIVTEDLPGAARLPVADFDFSMPVHLMYTFFDEYGLNETEASNALKSYSFKHTALQHFLLDI